MPNSTFSALYFATVSLHIHDVSERREVKRKRQVMLPLVLLIKFVLLLIGALNSPYLREYPHPWRPLHQCHRSQVESIHKWQLFCCWTHTLFSIGMAKCQKKALTLSAHLGRLFVFVVSFLVTSLFPTNDLKKILIKKPVIDTYYLEPTVLNIHQL